jgi:Protein of unknown function (DUF3768)
MDHTDEQLIKIRHLNDALRRTGLGGTVFITRGISDLRKDEQSAIRDAVATFDTFTDDNDPWTERDCATLTIGAREVMFKIDYYDNELQHASPAPWDPHQTHRVLTILLPEEY